jgi:hypothetical protein
VYTRNLTPSRTSSRTPYEVWHVNKWSPTQPDRNTPFSGGCFRIVIQKKNLKIRTRSILLRIASDSNGMRKENQSLLKQGARPEDQRKRHRRAKKTKENIWKLWTLPCSRNLLEEQRSYRTFSVTGKCFFFVFSFMILKEIWKPNWTS